MSISFVWFDLGCTLLYSTRSRSYRAVFAELGHGVEPEEFVRAYHLVEKQFMREHPGVFGRDPDTYAPWFLGELGHHLGIAVDLCRLWQRSKQVLAVGSEWVPAVGAADLLADLRRRGYRLGVISNWDQSARAILTANGFDGLFDHIIVSCEVGCAKPDRRIFDLALSIAGVAAEACVYVGDNYYVDTVGARAAGMASIVINPFGRLGVEEIHDVPIIEDVGAVAGWLASQRR